MLNKTKKANPKITTSKPNFSQIGILTVEAGAKNTPQIIAMISGTPIPSRKLVIIPLPFWNPQKPIATSARTSNRKRSITFKTTVNPPLPMQL